ncbi:GTP-binding protein Rit1 isoform X3 [Peromyscus eremicus]|uniref:GTP-binding protein Rit1 isoform X3 n=1 Tax=Peromyscus eremicus TaxID=42410 RepID=UPI0027DE1FF7|nr:GTP-binding protein Rit1 isoform X3 [Peromyscus eremicus]
MDSGARPVGGSCSSPAALSREYKLVMLGAGGVGKSAMTMQFISHRFPEDHDPTIEDAYKIRIRIDDEPANLDILDTAGQAEFTAMRDQYMRAGEGFIICYSITDRRSFLEVREFKQLIYRVRRTDDTPVVLVGNKSDLKQLRQEEALCLRPHQRALQRTDVKASQLRSYRTRWIRPEEELQRHTQQDRDQTPPVTLALLLGRKQSC